MASFGWAGEGEIPSPVFRPLLGPLQCLEIALSVSFYLTKEGGVGRCVLTRLFALSTGFLHPEQTKNKNQAT